MLCAPSAMSASRDSREAYIGVGSPVVAQCTRLEIASALRAMCVTTWARVHPSHRLGAVIEASSSLAAVDSSASVSAWHQLEVVEQV